MPKEIKYLQPAHPDWKGAVPDFLSVYTPVLHFPYALRQEKPYPIFVPEESTHARRCALCDGAEPGVSFNSDAHLLPAALGNRTWFSREECDGCNNKYGHHDGELANMLSAARVMGRVRSRSGTAKISALSGHGSVGGGTFDGPLLINIDRSDPDPSLVVEHLEDDRTLTLTFPQPAFRPFVAIRSLVRACWLGMVASHRERHPTLRHFVTGTLDPEVNEFFDVRTIGGSYSHVMLHAWERSEKCRLNVPRFVLRFCFVNRVLVWTAPDPSTGQHLPGPLPPLPFIADPASMRGTVRRGPLSASFTAGAAREVLKYEQLVAGSGATSPRTKPVRTERAVRLELVANGITTTIDQTQETIYEEDPIDQRARFRVSGGRFAGAVNVRIQGRKLDVSAQILPGGHSTSEVRLACELLRRMLTEGGTLRVVAATETRELDVESANGAWNGGSLERQLAAFEIIEREFGVEFSFPERTADDYEPIVAFLAAAIADGEVIVANPAPLVMTLLPETGDALIDLLRRSDVTVDANQDFVIFGQDLGSVPGKVTLVSPRLVNPSPEEISSRLAAGEQVDVTISMTRAIHEFPQWKNHGNGATVGTATGDERELS